VRGGGRDLLAIAPDAAGPGVRHRVLAFAPALEAAGVRVAVATWPKGFLARRRLLARAREAGAAWVVGRLLSVSDVARLRSRVRRLLFDFDDALPRRDSRRGAGLSRTRVARFRAVLAAADAVSAGNAHLAGLAREHGAEAMVLPTVVACPDGPGAPEPRSPPLVVGWIGSRSTLPYLEGRIPSLAAVVALGRPYRLRVVCDAFPAMPPGIPVDRVPWTPDAEGPALDGIHVGVAPLPDDAWTRGKCGLKVLQMLSRGRPVVASPVGVQAEQVRDGVTGCLPRTDGAFAEALLSLLEDAPLRARMGEAAREDVRARWSVGAWEERVVSFVAGALA
jgi:hypothetical protein